MQHGGIGAGLVDSAPKQTAKGAQDGTADGTTRTDRSLIIFDARLVATKDEIAWHRRSGGELLAGLVISQTSDTHTHGARDSIARRRTYCGVRSMTTR